MVDIEKLPEGGYRVSRVFPNGGSMQAAASALERINPEAFEPVAVPEPMAAILRPWRELSDGIIELRD